MKKIISSAVLLVLFCIVSCTSFDANKEINDEPSGKLIKGVRVVRIDKGLSKLDVFVYRGETVKLVFEPRGFRHSVHIPQYDISKDLSVDDESEVSFKAKHTGIFPIYCNGDCASGDGEQAGKIVVMKYETDKDAEFIVLSAKQAKKMLKKSDFLLLDVRTPREYYSGHIENSQLIPLYQLEDRINEIEDYKNKEIIIYCRSGNRSVVAAEILIQNGFKKIYHIGKGIRAWSQRGYDIIN